MPLLAFSPPQLKILKLIRGCFLLLKQLESFIGTGQQKLASRLYEHLVAQPQYKTSAARQALVRRLREALVKCIIINGIPVVIEAVTSINELEKPEDKDFSSSR